MRGYWGRIGKRPGLWGRSFRKRAVFGLVCNSHRFGCRVRGWPWIILVLFLIRGGRGRIPV